MGRVRWWASTIPQISSETVEREADDGNALLSVSVQR